MENLLKSYIIPKLEDIVSEIDYMPFSYKTYVYLLKEKARCSKTFPKKHIGVWYGVIRKPLDDIIVQGLLGRAGCDDPGIASSILA